MKTKLSMAAAAAALAGLALAGQKTEAAVVLDGTAPAGATNTFSSYPSTSSLNVATAGNLDYFALGAVTRGAATVPQVSPPGTNFNALSLLDGSGTASPSYRLGSAGYGVYVTDPTSSYSGYAYNQTEAAPGASGATDGVGLSYSLAAGATQTINYFIGSYDALYEYTLAASGQTVPLASVTTPTGLVAGDGTTGPGSGHSDGELGFTLTNAGLAASTVTFNLYYGGPNGASSGVGIGAAAVQAVPEPMTLSVIGLGGAGLLLRRRRTI